MIIKVGLIEIKLNLLILTRSMNRPIRLFISINQMSLNGINFEAKLLFYIIICNCNAKKFPQHALQTDLPD